MKSHVETCDLAGLIPRGSRPSFNKGDLLPVRVAGSVFGVEHELPGLFDHIAVPIEIVAYANAVCRPNIDKSDLYEFDRPVSGIPEFDC